MQSGLSHVQIYSSLSVNGLCITLQLCREAYIYHILAFLKLIMNLIIIKVPTVFQVLNGRRRAGWDGLKLGAHRQLFLEWLSSAAGIPRPAAGSWGPPPLSWGLQGGVLCGIGCD